MSPATFTLARGTKNRADRIAGGLLPKGSTCRPPTWTAWLGWRETPRVASVIAINPEYPEDLGSTPADVRALSISLGQLESTSADGQPTPSYVVPQASIFDAFAVCTFTGPKILMEEEGDASICGVSSDSRRAIHQDVSDAVISFLNGGPE